MIFDYTLDLEKPSKRTSRKVDNFLDQKMSQTISTAFLKLQIHFDHFNKITHVGISFEKKVRIKLNEISLRNQ